MYELETPTVGAGATMLYPQDAYPYVITRVSESGKTFWMEPLQDVSKATGHEPAYYEGGNVDGFPVWDHTYTEEELVSLRIKGISRRVSLRSDNSWRIAGSETRVSLKAARYHRNYSY